MWSGICSLCSTNKKAKKDTSLKCWVRQLRLLPYLICETILSWCCNFKWVIWLKFSAIQIVFRCALIKLEKWTHLMFSFPSSFSRRPCSKSILSCNRAALAASRTAWASRSASAFIGMSFTSELIAGVLGIRAVRRPTYRVGGGVWSSCNRRRRRRRWRRRQRVRKQCTRWRCVLLLPSFSRHWMLTS